MLSQKFYWGTVRKSVVAFGNLFNKLTIDRKDDNGNIIQTMRIPLAYAPKQKFLARIDQYESKDGEENIQVNLPRMSFEMVSLDYDPGRKINVMHQNIVKNTTTGGASTQYSPVPYNATMGLYIYAKNQDDALQIVEQILPYFNPDFNLTVNAVPDLDIKHDLQIVLNSLSYEDDYEGDFESRRAIIWSLMFTVKMNFYGPVSKQGFIRKAFANIYSDEEMSNLQVGITVTTDPANAMPGDTYTIIETFEEF